MNTTRPISLLLCALGGEGGGVLSQWLVEAARIAGYPAQSTSIPGVAQRTGATTYYVEVFPQPLAELGERRPVLSLNPVPGALDALVSSELLETTRQIGLGYASPDRTRVITSSARSFTTHERMQLADGRRDSAQLVDVVRRFSQEHHVLDMAGMAQQAGTVVSAVMLGAIAGSGLLPFERVHFEAAIGQGAQAAASLRGFASGLARRRCQPFEPCGPSRCGGVSSASACHVVPGLGACGGLPKPRLWPGVSAPHAPNLAGRGRQRPQWFSGLGCDARDGALAGPVDGV